VSAEPAAPQPPQPHERALDDDAGRPPRSSRAWGELGMVALLAAMGLVLLVDTRRITVPGSSNTVGPRFFPYAVGILLVVTAVLLTVAVSRGDRADADDSEDVDPRADTDWRAVGIIAAAFVGHALLINVVGWPLAVTVMFALVSKALGARGWVRPLLAGGVVSVVVWIIFVKALDVALPGGTLLEAVTGG
jgi:putative tricarboxylic transport membrane protein